MDLAIMKEKVLFFFVNIPTFIGYVYRYLDDTNFFYPLCDIVEE